MQDEYEWTNADVMIHNMARFLVNAADPEDDTPWYDVETGDDNLLWQIDCHPVFKNSTPCLNDVRCVGYNEPGWSENCTECKAKWMLEKYE